MRVVVFSDTHMPQRATALPERLVKEIETADALIHAGDFTSFNTYLEIRAFGKPLYAVQGNMDDGEIVQELPVHHSFELAGWHIGLTHGWGAPDGIEDRVVKHFERDDRDIIIFGHSHRVLNERRGKVLLLNPGSPTDTLFAPIRSFMILTLKPRATRDYSAPAIEIIRLD